MVHFSVSFILFLVPSFCALGMSVVTGGDAWRGRGSRGSGGRAVWLGCMGWDVGSSADNARKK